MEYKILYIEDLDADSIKSDIEELKEIETITLKPLNFNDTFLEMCKDEYEAILLDFRLQDGEEGIIFDAPTLAQSLRSKNVENKKFKPIFLITNQKNISSYYKDFSSHDLFDYVNEKTVFRQKIPNQCLKIKSFINAYKTIAAKNCDITAILNATESQARYVDYRIFELLSKSNNKDNVHKIAFFIYHKIIKSFNFLVGEDILSARFGISKDSEDWEEFKSFLQEYKYTGIYSQSHERWWWKDIENWLLTKTDNRFSLRRLKSSQRCAKLQEITGLKRLQPLTKIEHSKSEHFWTICKDSLLPLDPVDGLELLEKELLPWQETEYISMKAGLENSNKNQYLAPLDKQRMIEYRSSL